MQIWDFIYQNLSASNRVVLLCVLESKGSSPGRRGFKMAVSSEGAFVGTIGGGIMEFKLVEKAKSLLQNNITTVSMIEQHHDKEHAANQSGMICSGSQKIAFVPLSSSDIKTIETLKECNTKHSACFQLSLNGIEIISDVKDPFKFTTPEDWQYQEAHNKQSNIHIIGGGHVSLALSELMHNLDFIVTVYDDRAYLNTFQENTFADKKNVINYESINNYLHTGPSDFVVIMTVGYRTDKLILKQLLDKEFYYLGMLGSENKIKTMFAELIEEGFNKQQLDKLYAPIGINILSQTTKEIAISIAAEIIKKKNETLPTGRTEKPIDN